MRWSQATDTGLVRSSNEDGLRVSPKIGLFAVADGMGGHQAGEVASNMVLELLECELSRQLEREEDPGYALVDSIKKANLSIYEKSVQFPHLAGMGTTVTACLKQGVDVFVGQVGDSRAYLLRDGGINQLTEDHSLVQELLKMGGITAKEAFSHPRRNVLTRAVGIGPSLEVDLYHTQVKTGDIMLLCTDGLTRYLLPRELLFIISAATGPDEAVQSLLEQAISRGGADNITLILLEV